MTNLQALASYRRSPLRRKSMWAVAAVTAIAVLAGCSSPAKPKPKPSATISVASVVPPPPKPCAVSAMLVNSCRPWLGAAASGNPGAPHNAIEQFLYLERLLGHHLDIFRSYNTPPGSGGLDTLPLNHAEQYFAKQPGTYDDINWKPAQNWQMAGGGNAAVNTQIKQVADNIKAIAPHKVFLTVGVEPQNDVSGGSSCPLSPKASQGTPAQYKQMWKNVESIFRKQHVTNVIWTMDYMSDSKFDCLVPQLWPGNGLVDWVFYDSYDHDNDLGSSFGNTAGQFYQLLERDSSPSVDFESKPWGLGEFGTCKNNNASNSAQYFTQAKQAIDENAYPRLHLYNIFADTGGTTAGPGCLTDYTTAGQIDAGKNTAVKSLVNTPVFNK